MSERKPYGPREGEHWDLEKDTDVEELENIVDYEEPRLLTGGPPCDPFSSLRRLGAEKKDPEKEAEVLKRGLHHLHVACRFYRSNMPTTATSCASIRLVQPVGITRRPRKYSDCLECSQSLAPCAGGRWSSTRRAKRMGMSTSLQGGLQIAQRLRRC